MQSCLHDVLLILYSFYTHFVTILTYSTSIPTLLKYQVAYYWLVHHFWVFSPSNFLGLTGSTISAQESFLFEVRVAA